MDKLTEHEITERLSHLANWKLTDEKWILRKYVFKEYLKGIKFVQQIANVSEEADHHPFISIDYKVVTVKISSWQAKGLTSLDFELAKKYEKLYETIN